MKVSKANIAMRIFLAALLALSIQVWHAHALPAGGNGSETLESNADLHDHFNGSTGNATCFLCLLAGSAAADITGPDDAPSLIETQTLQPAPSPSLHVIPGRIQADRGPPSA